MRSSDITDSDLCHFRLEPWYSYDTEGVRRCDFCWEPVAEHTDSEAFSCWDDLASESERFASRLTLPPS